MFEIVPGVGWLILAYVIGTGFGMWVNFQKVIGGVIDSLIENGYLRHREMPDGGIEILKYDEE